jgi:hypothetical protein
MGSELKKEESLIEVKVEHLKKIGDAWTRHNVSTRIAMLVFMVSFLMIAIAGVKGIVVPVAIVNMVFYSAIIAYATVTLGINGIETLLNGIAKIKLGKNN